MKHSGESRFRRNGRPLVYGHRGVRGPLPENTMAAFQRAHDEGADGIELDVRQAESGEVIVFHDPSLRRMTMGFDSREVAAVPWRELQRADLGGGERIPSLNDVLDWIVSTDLLLNVELKRDLPSRTGLVIAVARLLSRAKAMKDRLIISSFDPVMLAWLNVLLPLVPKAILFHAGQEHYRPWLWARFGPWQAAHPEHVMVDAAHVQSVHGRVVNVWTVNDAAEAVALANSGVDGIITDRPGVILDAISGAGAASFR